MPTNIKVGDQLAFDLGFAGWRIYTVEKITPTGRIKCGPYQLTPDLQVMGKKSRGYWGPYRGLPITDKIRESVRKNEIVNELGGIEWERFPLDALEKIYAIAITGDKECLPNTN